MALSASSMKQDIIDALDGEAESAVIANKKFGDAVLKNICDNITITYGWSAADPSSGVPDPAAVFSATVSGGGTLAPSATFPEMLVKLSVLVKGLTITAPAGFAVAPLVFNPAGVLAAVMALENTQDLAMTSLCPQIIASIIAGYPNPAPAAGAHGSFIGATIGMVIA